VSGRGHNLPPTGVIGAERPRIDARVRATGQLHYADDLSLPRMLHCRLLRSPHPHARILSIDTRAADGLDGVELILTGEAFPVPYGILPISQDEHALARGKVRYVGEPVVAVIARDERTAQAGVDAVVVQWDVLPPVRDAIDGVGPLEHPLYGEPGTDSVHKAVSFDFGDVDGGFADADRVYDDCFDYAGNTHLALEQHASLAAVTEHGRLTLWSSTQVPHYVHKALAKVLELPEAELRVVAIPNGGGFGGKSDIFHHEMVVAKAAWMLGRPVKIALRREEVFQCHRGRHPVQLRLRTGVKEDGSITAMHLQTLVDGGGAGSYGVASTYYTGSLQTVTYEIPTYRFQGCRVFTNKAPCGPKRGHGTPQPRFGLEIQLDKIADDLGIDPAELRLRIVEHDGAITANWMRVVTIGLADCIKQVVKSSGWNDKHRKLPRGRGVGIACSSYLSGAGLPIQWNKMPHSAVQIRVDRSGLVTAYCGATEIGQGSDDVLASCVAEVLGLRSTDVRVVTGDTDLCPVDLGSYSSRVTLMMGNAAVDAAVHARNAIAEALAGVRGVPADQVRFFGGRVLLPDGDLSFAAAVKLAEVAAGPIGSVGWYTPPKPVARYKGGGVGPTPTYSYTAAVVEVDVDEDTGFIDVPKIWIAHDIGRALNATLARNQVIGSVYMGLGEALMEEQAMRRGRPSGHGAWVHRGPSMLDYKSPTHLDMPPVHVDLIERPDPEGPFGAKEVGQGPLLPIMPALANALYDAVGVRAHEVPITPDKVLKALARQRAGKDSTFGDRPFPDGVPWPESVRVPTPADGGDGRAAEAGDYAPGQGSKA